MRKNCMDKVAEMLGLKLGETFKITKDNAEKQQYFRLTKEGVIVSVDGVHWSDSTTTVALEDILTGRVKVTVLPWKPRDNEHYFIPEITTPEMFSYLEWTNDYVDNHMYKHGLICRTKEEAIRKAELLMEYFKNNCIEGNEKMTNHMAEVAQMLGVELEEVFKVTDDDSGKYHNYYKFTEKKGIEVSEDNVKWEADTAGTLVLKWLLIGVARIIKLPWKPQKGEKYYIPCIGAQPEYMYSVNHWDNDDIDKKYYHMGIVCKTKEEAIALTEKMLEAINEQ